VRTRPWWSRLLCRIPEKTSALTLENNRRFKKRRSGCRTIAQKVIKFRDGYFPDSRVSRLSVEEKEFVQQDRDLSEDRFSGDPTARRGSCSIGSPRKSAGHLTVLEREKKKEGEKERERERWKHYHVSTFKCDIIDHEAH